jgi:dienelactone hydrolase
LHSWRVRNRHLVGRGFLGLAVIGVLSSATVLGCGLQLPGAPAPGTGAGQASAASPSTVPSRYDEIMALVAYDHSKPFDEIEASARQGADSTIHDVSYSGLEDDRWRAYLVIPDGTGPFPAVMYLHGGFGDPTNFLAEAERLAAHGVAALLLTQPEKIKVPITDAEVQAEIVFEMRELQRSLDYLASRPEIDPSRLGFFGFSFGAIRGVTFSGIAGARLKVAVIASTPPTYNIPALADFDPIVWAPRISPAAFYLQEGTQDTWFTHAEAESLIAAAREPKKLTWYNEHHGLNERAVDDRIGWMSAALGGH